MEDKYRSDLDKTVEYYEENAAAFIGSTINADVSRLYNEFEEYLFPGARILDLGCGSGRDSKYFFDRGYDVVAIDPSLAMCEQTKSIVNIPVFQMKAEEMPFKNEFDAVWACASLLHISRDKQEKTLWKIAESLKGGGILYSSWKYGNEDRFIAGRRFTDYSEESMGNLLEKLYEFDVVKIWTTQDVRIDRSAQKWLNVLLRKIERYQHKQLPMMRG